MIPKITEFFQSVKGKRVAFVGIGRSNLPLLQMFADFGAKVIACDKNTDLPEEIKGLATQSGAELNLGSDYLQNLDADILFRTPGMKFYSPELSALRDRGVVVTSEMEVFFDLCPCKIAAVTGSDGKTTTTTIISEMLRAEGKTVHLGGNIGAPLLPKIFDIKPEDYAVAELSSFQLISMRQSPNIAVVTNLAPNHLDIHKDMQEYIDAKKNIFLHQNAFGKTVLNFDNEITNSFFDEVRGERAAFSRQEKVSNGAFLDGSAVKYNDYGRITEVMDISDIKIPGMHNVENYLAAVSALWGIVSPENMRRVARSFNGVAHRAELVRELDGVKYYNDSIASSPTRTALGTLSLYDRKIILIAGGYDKKIPYEPLGPVICDKVKVLILMGATAPKIKAAVVNCENYSKDAPKILLADNMLQAVNLARENALSGDIVSLSPASASFDLYKNFEERGNHFKKIVNELK